MCRRLCEVLLRIHLFQCQLRSCLQAPDSGVFLFLFLIRIGVNGHETIKCQTGGSCCKEILSCIDPCGNCLIDGRLHAACHKAFPDQLIQAEQISWQGFFYHYRCIRHIGRTDGLVRILCLAVFILRRVPACGIFCAVLLLDKGTCCRIGLLADSCRIGTQIGNQSDRSLSLYFHALVELLRQTHRLLRGEVQHLRCFLLQGTRGERKRRFLGTLSFFHFGYGKGLIFQSL